MATLDQFLAAERAQESGGNYSVVNSIGAMGAYQVMPSNLASWTRSALGHTDTEQQFLNSPADQDAVARYELGPVFSAHGPAGAAAWWYSGQTDPTKTYGNPPVYKYVQEVLGRIGSAGTVTGGATPADYTGGSTVEQAGLQQAGYQAAMNLTPWGIPLNPFKIPGYVAGKLGSAGQAAGGAIGQGFIDTLGPVILAAIGVTIAGGLVLIGSYVTVKPSVDKATQSLPAAAEVAA